MPQCCSFKLTTQQQDVGVREMSTSDRFNTFAAARGEGLHPKLRDLLERATASPSSVVAVRHDGMLQAGPSLQSEKGASPGSVMSFGDGKHSAAPTHAQETQTPRRRMW